jgi:hypothetical protein
MRTEQQELPAELVFEPDGHVSELCVTAVADGEIEIVPRAALDHLDACDACGDKLGNAALLAAVAHEAMREAEAPMAAASADAALTSTTPVLATPASTAPASIAPASPRPPRRPVPYFAIAAAILLATITAGPALSDAISAAPEVASATVAWGPTLLKAAAAVAWSGASLGPWGIAIEIVSAVMFVAAGIQVARVTSRRRASTMEGSVQ